MSIYTKAGDLGETSLIGGVRVKKCDERVDAYGTLDELSAFIGVLHDMVSDTKKYQDNLMQIQRHLFIIEAVLACPQGKTIEGLKEDDINWLETRIDEIEKQLPPLHSWLIPGGSITSSYSHVCRTVCRRAERLVVKVGAIGNELKYLNRLSDYFFVFSRILQ